MCDYQRCWGYIQSNNMEPKTKYRGWDGKKMLPPQDLTQNGKYWSWLGKIDVTLMQFTGLRDKNGKEIYFDDIIKFSQNDDENEGTAVVVETMSGGAGILSDWEIEFPLKKWAVTSGGVIEEIWEDEVVWTFEVIGNIYETPELVKA